MKALTLTLPAIGMIFAFAAPAGASALNGAVLDNTPTTVNQQDTCKAGEVWDETQKKCVKKEG